MIPDSIQYNNTMKISDVVFTNHAIERMKQRGISGDWVWQAVKKADKTIAGKEKHTTESIKQFGEHTVTAITKKNDLGEWVVLSAWMDPPIQGTIDYFKKQKYNKSLKKAQEYAYKMEKASFWGKLWLTFKKQAGF